VARELEAEGRNPSGPVNRKALAAGAVNRKALAGCWLSAFYSSDDRFSVEQIADFARSVGMPIWGMLVRDGG